MHVRWEIEGENRHKRLTAVLVADRSEDGGRACSYLGSIEERFLTVNIPMTREFHQGLFWKGVARNLEAADLDGDTRQRIESEICRRVPKPDDEWPLWGVTCIPRYEPRS